MIRVEVDGVVVFEEMGEVAQERPAQTLSGLATQLLEADRRYTYIPAHRTMRDAYGQLVRGEAQYARGATPEETERARYQDPHLPYFTRSARWVSEAEFHNTMLEPRLRGVPTFRAVQLGRTHYTTLEMGLLPNAGAQRYTRVRVYQFEDTGRSYAVRAIPAHAEFEFFHWEEGARCPLFDEEGDEVPVGGLVERQELARMEAERELLRQRQQEVAEYWAMTNPQPIVLQDNGRQVYPAAQVEEGTPVDAATRPRMDLNALNEMMRRGWEPHIAEYLNTTGRPFARAVDQEIAQLERQRQAVLNRQLRADGRQILNEAMGSDPPDDDYDTIIADN